MFINALALLVDRLLVI